MGGGRSDEGKERSGLVLLFHVEGRAVHPRSGVEEHHRHTSGGEGVRSRYAHRKRVQLRRGDLKAGRGHVRGEERRV